MEEWLPIEGFMDYSVSSNGKIKSYKIKSKGKHLKPRINQGGYYYVNLCKDGKYHSIQVHSLVAKAFVSGYQPGLMVNHKDGNKLNNLCSNFEWVTNSENMKHAVTLGLLRVRYGTECNLSKLSADNVQEIRKLRKEGWTQKKIGDRFKTSRSNVSQILSGKLWKGTCHGH
jgi:hypothetical protein